MALPSCSLNQAQLRALVEAIDRPILTAHSQPAPGFANVKDLFAIERAGLKNLDFVTRFKRAI
jgi:hypothetical protein